MTVALSFPSETTNFSLPMLFAGQAQKEFFINQALAMIDGLLQLSVEESQSAPPPNPTDGQCFRVLTPSSGDWTGKDDQLAIYLAGSWCFVTATNGMRIFDRAAKQFLVFNTVWSAATEPGEPLGGTVIDTEARTAINELIQTLRNTGVFPS